MAGRQISALFKKQGGKNGAAQQRMQNVLVIWNVANELKMMGTMCAVMKHTGLCLGRQIIVSGKADKLRGQFYDNIIGSKLDM